MKEKVARLIELDRVIRQSQAEKLRLIAELNIDEWAARDIAMALQLSQSNGEYLVKWATRVATVFPEVLEAMAAGVISEWSAHGLVDPTENYSPEVARKAVTKTLETAEGRCCQQLRRSVQGRLQRADPAGHARRCAERRRDRKVEIYDEVDGMAVLKTEQPVEIAQMMYAKVDRLAREEPKKSIGRRPMSIGSSAPGIARVSCRVVRIHRGRATSIMRWRGRRARAQGRTWGRWTVGIIGTSTRPTLRSASTMMAPPLSRPGGARRTSLSRNRWRSRRSDGCISGYSLPTQRVHYGWVGGPLPRPRRQTPSLTTQGAVAALPPETSVALGGWLRLVVRRQVGGGHFEGASRCCFKTA